MKKIFLILFMVVLTSVCYSTEFDQYSKFTYENHIGIFNSISTMVYSVSDDLDLYVFAINRQCLSFYVCIAAYESGELSQKQMEMMEYLYNDALSMIPVNWEAVLEQFDRMDKESFKVNN